MNLQYWMVMVLMGSVSLVLYKKGQGNTNVWSILATVVLLAMGFVAVVGLKG